MTKIQNTIINFKKISYIKEIEGKYLTDYKLKASIKSIEIPFMFKDNEEIIPYFREKGLLKLSNNFINPNQISFIEENYYSSGRGNTTLMADVKIIFADGLFLEFNLPRTRWSNWKTQL